MNTIQRNKKPISQPITTSSAEAIKAGYSDRSELIWLALDSRNFGGIESHVEQLAQAIKNRGYRVCVVFLCDYFYGEQGAHPLLRKLAQHNIEYQLLNGSVKQLWQTLKQQNPTAVHTHGYKAGILLRAMSTLLGITCVSTYHSGETKRGKMALYDWLDRQTARLASSVFAVSTPILKQIPSPARFAANFINLNKVIRSQGKQIAFVGRLSFEKAPERLLVLARQLPEQTFHIYGDGPLKNQLIAQAPNNVKFHGACSDMENVWSQIGLLIMPSRAEGLPMAAIEAMARGIAIVATRVGELPRLISHGQNGWLIDEALFNEPSLDSHPSPLKLSVEHWLTQNEVQRKQMQSQCELRIRACFNAEIEVTTLLRAYGIKPLC